MKNWKDLIIEDQIKTIKRMNEQLKDRIEFESKLMEIITKLQKEEVGRYES